MCGILGTINIPFNEDNLSLIKQRGPDDWGIKECNVCGNRIILGHRRLSIVDLSQSGHQPMNSECNKYHLIYNGELYNHLDLRNKLIWKAFKGHSDTETILYSLKEIGISAINNFNGIFAFAFLSEPDNKLWLVRDPFGVKPLYYYVKNNHIAFSSEIKPILSLVQTSLDCDNLALLLQLRYTPSPLTLFHDIKKVHPGHYLEIDLSTLSVKEISFVKKLPEYWSGDEKELVAEYGRQFDRAIKKQLMADVDVGVLLSGGIDSAMVAAKAKEFSNRNIQAFTVGFQEDCSENEIKKAAETARILGLDHHYVPITNDDFFDNVKKVIEIVEEPLATTSAIPMMALSKLAASKVKVVLTGQGADEPLGGYGRYQSEILRRYWPAKLLSPCGPMLKAIPLKKTSLSRGLKTFWIKDDIPRFLKTYEVFSDKEIYKLTGRKPIDPAKLFEYTYHQLDCISRRHPVERMMSVDSRMNLSDDLLLYTDKITMHYSLECRVPLLDLDLVSFIESLPFQYRVRYGHSKIIHKQYAASFLPQEIINRKKLGFQSPTKRWFSNSELLCEIFEDSNSKFSSFFSIKEIKHFIKKHKQGYNKERELFLLMSIKYWIDMFS